MKTQIKGYPLRRLMVMTADWTVNPNTSKAALRKLAADPDFDWSSEVLLDFRGVDCEISAIDIFELAKHMAFPNPALPTYQKVALLVDRHSSDHVAFDHAHLLELCAASRGANIRAFHDYDSANAWLNADLPKDPRDAGMLHH